MPRGPSIDVDIRDKIQELAIRGHGPAAILRALEEDDRVNKARLPSVRQVQRIVRQTLPPPTSGSWGIRDGAPEDARLILEAIPDIVQQTKGLVRLPRAAEAAWLARIRSVAPDLAPWAAYVLALVYAQREAAHEPTEDLDVFLGYAPWRSVEAAKRYQADRKQGWVPNPPPFFLTSIMVQLTQQQIAEAKRRQGEMHQEERGTNNEAARVTIRLTEAPELVDGGTDQ